MPGTAARRRLRWEGQCRACGAWNTLVETLVTSAPPGARGSAGRRPTGRQRRRCALRDLTEAPTASAAPIGIGEVDRVLGGGLVPGSLVLLGGEPGIGKSTLVLETPPASPAAPGRAHGRACCTPRARSRRHSCGCGRSAWAWPTIAAGERDRTSSPRPTSSASSSRRGEPRPALLVVDSIQTLTADALEGPAGSVGQVREAAARLRAFAKEHGVPGRPRRATSPRTARSPGPRRSSTWSMWCWRSRASASAALRLLRATKNRFGSTEEVGVLRDGRRRPARGARSRRARSSGRAARRAGRGRRGDARGQPAAARGGPGARRAGRSASVRRGARVSGHRRPAAWRCSSPCSAAGRPGPRRPGHLRQPGRRPQRRRAGPRPAARAGARLGVPRRAGRRRHGRCAARSACSASCARSAASSGACARRRGWASRGPSSRPARAGRTRRRSRGLEIVPVPTLQREALAAALAAGSPDRSALRADLARADACARLAGPCMTLFVRALGAPAGPPHRLPPPRTRSRPSRARPTAGFFLAAWVVAWLVVGFLITALHHGRAGALAAAAACRSCPRASS